MFSKTSTQDCGKGEMGKLFFGFMLVRALSRNDFDLLRKRIVL